MLIPTQLIPFDGVPFGRMFGTLGLGLTPVFKCGITQCYSTDGEGVGNGTDGLFRKLQATINRFRSEAGFKKISVDGFIGSSTVDALQKTAQWILSRTHRVATSTTGFMVIPTSGKYVGQMIAIPPPSALFVFTMKKSVAQNAQYIYDTLSEVARVFSLPAMESITSSTSKPPTTSPVPGFPSQPADEAGSNLPSIPDYGNSYTDSSSAFQRNWPWYLGGGILLAGLATATWLVWSK